MRIKQGHPGILSFREKLSYSLGTLGDQLSTNGITNTVKPIYNIFLGVNPAIIGLALMIGKVVDSFTDPIMGWFSDNTRSRFGRRKPYILLGSVLTSLAFILPWMVSPGWSNQFQFIYLIAATTIVALASTVYTVPWTALGMELTPDYYERNSVMAFRTFTTMLCFVTIIPWLWYWSQNKIFENPVVGLRWISVGVGLIILLGGMACFRGCRERYYRISGTQETQRFLSTIKITLRNKSFLIILGLTLCQVIGMSAAQSLGLYVSTYHVYGGDTVKGAGMIAIFQVVQAVSGMVSIPVVLWAASRYGKRAVMAATFILAIIASSSQWFLFTPHYPWLQLIPPIFIAPSNAAFWMINGSMRADIADDDEINTGIRREGTYGSIARWFEKLAYSLNYLLSGLILNWVGFDIALKGAQGVQTITQMRAAYAFYPVILCFIGLILVKKYPLTEAKLEEYRIILDERRGRIT
jgi:glycoside/pentoside/hexuronide:cation symporter, GPH family